MWQLAKVGNHHFRFMSAMIYCDWACDKWVCWRQGHCHLVPVLPYLLSDESIMARCNIDVSMMSLPLASVTSSGLVPSCVQMVIEPYIAVRFVMWHRSSNMAIAHTIFTWLILPVVICLSQRLSHACLSLSYFLVKLRMAHYISYNMLNNFSLHG